MPRAAQAVEKAKGDALKAAKANPNPLVTLPPAFTAYCRNGIAATVEHHSCETTTHSHSHSHPERSSCLATGRSALTLS